MKRGSTNKQLLQTIAECRKTKKPFWLAVANLMARPNRRRIRVNLWQIGRHAKDGETVVVPGRVLGNGELKGKVRVAAFWFSASASKKLGDDALPLASVLAQNPNGTGLHIMA
ncbi:50S ribosomal protein L18e [Candidatus Micrarchaeota archaeon]|nr:50S ribosomal protein L18e [Candidatus Micrarchaeota archaeon]